MNTTLFTLSAVLSLIPASLIMWRRVPARDGAFWAVIAVAIAGPLAWVWVRQSQGWHTGLSTALWVTVLVCMVLFVIVAAATREGWRLTPLLLPYLVLLGILATIWAHTSEQELRIAGQTAWLDTHIVVSVVTYGLVTLAAIAAMAAALQDRALKSKKRTALSRVLPSVADSERLLTRLLATSEAVLALGLLSGMATLYFEDGKLFEVDHKTLFSVGVFIVLGVLLWIQHRSGARGKVVTRLVLLAYLMLTLGYPGVKFVKDILIG
jgi:ABC-type uncharacterized transport system permease subunit